MKHILLTTVLLTTPASADGVCPFWCSEETPVARNQVYIQTTAQSFLSFGVQGDLVKKAAETTLRHGFTRFVLRDMNSGNELTPSGFSYGGGWGDVYSRRVGSASANVLMLRAGDPGYENALDARQVLAGG